MLQGSKGLHVCYKVIKDTSMLISLIFTHEKSAKTVLLAIRLVLILLATFLESLFNLFTLQNLIGLYAFNNIHRRQMLAIAAVYRQTEAEKKAKSIEVLVFTTATTITVRDPL